LRRPNYYLGFDGTHAWSLFAGRQLPSGNGVLFFAGAAGTKQIVLPSDRGTPTLTLVTDATATFTTSRGHIGVLDLQPLAVTFTN
jgi:hypothetical protein